jgi:hypothetical protein
MEKRKYKSYSMKKIVRGLKVAAAWTQSKNLEKKSRNCRYW